MTVTEDLAKQHYAEHDERPFFGELVELHHLRPDHGARLRGRRRDQAARQVIGATNPLEATTGSIRGDFAIAVGTEHGPRLGLAGVRRCARPRCSSARTLRLDVLACRASPQRRAILEQVGIAFDVRVSGVEEETHGDPVAVAEENARRKAPGRRRRDGSYARRGHAGRRRRRHPRQAAPTRTRRASTSRAWPGRTHQVVGAIALVRDGGSPTPRSRSPRSTSARRAPRCSTGTSPPASGRAARAATPSRAPAPPSWRASRATTSTWSACRSPACSTSAGACQLLLARRRASPRRSDAGRAEQRDRRAPSAMRARRSTSGGPSRTGSSPARRGPCPPRARRRRSRPCVSDRRAPRASRTRRSWRLAGRGRTPIGG